MAKQGIQGAQKFNVVRPIMIRDFRQYLPMEPPNSEEAYPKSIRDFLVSTEFVILALDEQERRRQIIQHIYRGHYSLDDATKHLNKVSNQEVASLQSFCRQYGRREDVVDWYALVRNIYSSSRTETKQKNKPNELQAVLKIQNAFRDWRKKKATPPVESKDMSSIERGPNDNQIVRLIRRKFQIAPQSLRQLFERIDKNKNGEISKEQFNHFLKELQIVGLDQKKSQKLFLYFDKDEKDFFNYNDFLSFLFKKQMLSNQYGYLSNLDLILQEMSIDLRQVFPNAKEFQSQFQQFVNDKQDFRNDILQQYLNKKIGVKYSLFQCQQIIKHVGSEKYIGKVYNWNINQVNMTAHLKKKEVVAQGREMVSKQLEQLIKIAYFLLDKNDLKDVSYNLEQFIDITKEITRTEPARIFFNLFRGLTTFRPYRLNLKFNVPPIAARLMRENSKKQLFEMKQQTLKKYSVDQLIPGKHLAMLIYDCFNQRMTDLDFKAMNVELKQQYNIHQQIEKLFNTKQDHIIRVILNALAFKIYKHYREYKKYKRMKQEELNEAMDIVSTAIKPILDKKSPRKSKIEKPKAEKPKVKSDFEDEARKIILQIIDGSRNKPKELQIHQKTTKQYVFITKVDSISYGTNMIRFLPQTCYGSLFFNEALMAYQNNQTRNLHLRYGLTQPGAILDACFIQQTIYILMSNLQLLSYNLNSTNNYNVRMLKLTHENNCDLSIYKNRFFNKYPYLMKLSNNLLYVNLTMKDNKMYIIEPKSYKVIEEIELKPSEYYVTPFQERIILKMKRILADRQYSAIRIIRLDEYPMSRKAFKHLLRINFKNLQQFPDEMESLLNLLQISEDVTTLQAFTLRSMLQEKSTRILFQNFIEIQQLIHEYIHENNISLLQFYKSLDPNNQGFVSYKIFKQLIFKLESEDYEIQDLLVFIDPTGKIHYNNLHSFMMAQLPSHLFVNEIQKDFSKVPDGQTFSECNRKMFRHFQYSNEDIENYLEHHEYDYDGRLLRKKVKQGQHWMRMFEKPRILVEDYAIIEDYDLMIHTIDGEQMLYLSNSSEIMCILQGHRCDLAPSFIYIPDCRTVVSGDKHTNWNKNSNLLIWNLQQGLFSKHTTNPPWTIKPTKIIYDVHAGPICSIGFMSRCAILVTGSTDSTIKFWNLDQSLKQTKRIYTKDTVVVECLPTSRKVNNNLFIERVHCMSIEKRINKGNINQISAMIETFYCDILRVETKSNQDFPIKLRKQLDELAMKLYGSKLQMENKKIYESQKEIQTNEKIYRTMELQFYNNLKKIITGQLDDRQLRQNYQWLKQLQGTVFEGLIKTMLGDIGLKNHQIEYREETMNEDNPPIQLQEYQQRQVQQQKLTPQQILRKLYSQLTIRGLQPWMLFSLDKQRLFLNKVKTKDELKQEFMRINVINHQQIDVILNFLDGPKGIFLKQFVDCINKAINYVDIRPIKEQPSKQRKSTLNMAASASPKGSENRSEFQNFQQISEIQKSVVDSNMPSPRQFRTKNFEFQQMDNLNKLKEQLVNDAALLKKLRNKCSIKKDSQGLIQINAFRDILQEQIGEDRAQQISRQLSQWFDRVNYDLMLPKFSQDNELEDICSKMYDLLKHNTLNLSPKEYLRMLKIDDMTKLKLGYLLKKLKIQLKFELQNQLISYLKCARSISLDDFLKAIHPRKYHKPIFRQAVIDSLLLNKDTIIESVKDSIETMSVVDILQHVPWTILKNILINPKFQLVQSDFVALQEYLKAVRKEEYKFEMGFQESQLNINVNLLFQLLQKTTVADSDNKSVSSSSRSASKQSVQREPKRKHEDSRISSSTDLSLKVQNIVQRGQYKLRESGKSIWTLLSMVNPDWSDNLTISKVQFFRVFDTIDPNIKIQEKVDMLRYCDREKSGDIPIDVILEVFENKLSQGEIDRFILSKIAQILELRQLDLSKVFSKLPKNKISALQVSQIFTQEPFEFPPYIIKEILKIVSNLKKQFDDVDEVIEAMTSALKKHGILVTDTTSTIIKEICTFIDSGTALQSFFPITSNGKVNKAYVEKCLQKITTNQADLQQLWRSIVQRIGTDKKMSDKKLLAMVLQHTELVKSIRQMVQEEQYSKAREISVAKRVYKAIQNRNMEIMEFYLLVDRARKHMISELQFNTGLRELGIADQVWRNIKKKNTKWLIFQEFVQFLIDNEACQIFVADTDLQVAMGIFIKRIIKNQRIDKVFIKMATFNGQSLEKVNFQSFQKFLQNSRVLKPYQEQLVFSALVNADALTKSRLGNDTLLNDPKNLEKGFSYRELIRLYYHYIRKNIKKTALYRLSEAIGKRKVSLFQEMVNFMQANRKNKEIAESLKNKEVILSKQLATQFINQLNTGLSDKDIKQIISLFEDNIRYDALQSRIENTEQAAKVVRDQPQTITNSHRLLDCIKQMGSSPQRLFKDFDSSHKDSMSLADFNRMCEFLSTGLNKIQVKLIFQMVDETNRNAITSYELSSLFENILKQDRKAQEELELDDITARIVRNRSKLKFPSLVLQISEEQCLKIFKDILNSLEIDKLFEQLRKRYGKYIDYGKLQQFIQNSAENADSKAHKKAKSALKKVLSFLGDHGLTTKDWFKYFTVNNTITKQQFFLLMQTLPFHFQLQEIDELFSFLDEARVQSLTLEQINYKVDLVMMSVEKIGNQEATKLYYKTKVRLQQVYMHFVKKMFRDKQITTYFDVNGTGTITGRQFLQIVSSLGIQLQDNEKKKIVKYLAKDEAGNIAVSNLIKQFKSCLPNQTKEVLDTKVFQIFKQYQDILQEQPELFVDRLLALEKQLKIADQKKETLYKSITERDLFNLMKDFGILLSQQELQDIREGFGINQGNLDLKKIYELIDSILSNNSKQQQALQVVRYLKLLKYFKSKGISFSQVDQLVGTSSTVHEFTQLLQSFNILRPIEVKRLVDPLVIMGTTQIDLSIFRDNLLNSYYGEYREVKGREIEQSPTQKLKSHLLSKNPNVNGWLSQLANKSALSSKESFEDTLRQSGIVMSKKDMNSVLKELSGEMSQIDRGKVYALFGKTHGRVKTSQSFHPIDQENEHEHHDRLYELFEHLSLSLLYKQRSMLEGMRQCGCSEQGKATFENLSTLMKRTGFEITAAQLKELMVDFGENIDVKQLQKILQQMNFKTIPSTFRIIEWMSKAVSKFGRAVWLANIDIQKMLKIYADRQETLGWQQLYCLLYKRFPAEEDGIKQFINCIYKGRRLTIPTILSHLEPLCVDRQIHQKITQIPYEKFKKLLHQANFILNLQCMLQKISNLLNHELKFSRGLKMLANQLIMSQVADIMSIGQVVTIQQKQAAINQNLTFLQPPNNINKKSLVFEEAIAVDNWCYLINNAYFGYKSYELCQKRAIVEAILNGSATIYHSDNYFCLSKHSSDHPSGVIAYNWKCIPQFARQILMQILAVHRHGYCLTNLRWRHLAVTKGIVTTEYPTKIDSRGNLIDCQRQSYQIDDPYVSPELYCGSQTSLQVDVWSFGCIMIQFIFGCPPDSILSQLSKLFGKRLSQLVQLPSSFNYLWLPDDKLKNLFRIELQNQIQGKLSDIFQTQSSCSTITIQKIQRCLRQVYKDDSQLETLLPQLIQILFLISRCLNFDPRHRPTIEELLKHPLFEQNKNIKMAQILNGLQLSLPVGKQLQNFNKSQEKTQFLLQFLKNNKNRYFPESVSVLKINQQRSQLPSSVMSKYLTLKQCQLNSQNSFIRYMFSSMIVRKLIDGPKGKKQQKALTELLTQISEHFRRYSSAMALYSKQFLKDLIVACLNSNNDDILKLSFDLEWALPFLKLYRRIIGKNGQPTIDYLPLYDTIIGTEELNQYHHAMSTILSLYENYYGKCQKDEIFAGLSFLIQIISQGNEGYMKAIEDSKCLKFVMALLNQQDFRQKSLQLFFCVSRTPRFQFIFSIRVTYLVIFGRLAQTKEPTACKKIALSILCELLLLKNPEILSYLSDCTFSIFETVLKMAIEPLKDSPEKSIFIELKTHLDEVIQMITSEQEIRRAADSVKGAACILQG